MSDFAYAYILIQNLTNLMFLHLKEYLRKSNFC